MTGPTLTSTRAPEQGGKRVLGWACLPVLLALFGMSCSLISRVHLGGAESVPSTVVLGVAAAFLLGLPFMMDEITVGFRLFAASQAAVCAVVLLSVLAGFFVGDAMDFVLVHFLLTIGMFYQVMCWVLLARYAVEHGVGVVPAVVIGFVFCCLYVLLGEFEAQAVAAWSSGTDSATVFGLVQLMLSIVLIAVYLATHALERTGGTTEQTVGSGLGDPEAPAADTTLDALERAAAQTVVANAAPYGLTPRETDIMSMLVLGDSLASIADKNFISVGTVKSHLSHAYRKLGVSNRRDAVDKLLGRG